MRYNDAGGSVHPFENDDVMKRLFSKYFAIEEGHVPDEKDRVAFKKEMFEEMQQYVHDN